MSNIDFPVAIVGCGPVGLTLAMDLGWRGVRCVGIDERTEIQPTSPRCNTTNARSMEHFRRLGCADRVRSAGLPADHPTDVVYATRFAGFEIARLVLPSRSRRHTAADVHDAGWPTPEPQHRISQMYLEPILADHARSFPTVELRKGCRLESLEQQADRVVLTTTDVTSGARESFTARWVVGCDGARSKVRNDLGIKYVGHGKLSELALDKDDSRDPMRVRILEDGMFAAGTTRSVFFRSAELAKVDRHGPAWMYVLMNPEQMAIAVAIDGRELWVCHLIVPTAREHDFDIERALRTAIGADIELTILDVEAWTPRRLVAERYRSGRAFIAGDAAHIWPPLGGFGMNVGIGDATWLAWALAGIERGWADERILDAYEIERRQIAELVSRVAVQIEQTRGTVRFPPVLEADDEEGRAFRGAMGADLRAKNGPEFNSVGVQLGYCYDGSPIISYDSTPCPPFVLDRYEPSTRPGARLPHFWLEAGRSVYDVLGKDFTLLRSGSAPPDASAFVRAFEERKVPLVVLDVSDRSASELLGEPLVLVRPDQHVAWRGAAVPADPLPLVDRLRGATRE